MYLLKHRILAPLDDGDREKSFSRYGRVALRRLLSHTLTDSRPDGDDLDHLYFLNCKGDSYFDESLTRPYHLLLSFCSQI